MASLNDPPFFSPLKKRKKIKSYLHRHAIVLDKTEFPLPPHFVFITLGKSLRQKKKKKGQVVNFPY